MEIAWRAVTAVSAAGVGLAVAAGLAGLLPDTSTILSMLRGLAVAASGLLAAVGTFRTIRFGLVGAGVPADHRFVPDAAPRSVADLADRIVRSRQALGATALLVGLLLGVFGARIGGSGESADEFAELPRYGYQNAAEGGFALNVPDTTANASSGDSAAGPDGGDGGNGGGSVGARPGGDTSENGGSQDDGSDHDGSDDDGDGPGGGDIDEPCTGPSCEGGNEQPPNSEGTDLDDDLCEVVDAVEDEGGELLDLVDGTTDDTCDAVDTVTDEACGAVGQPLCSTLDDTTDAVDDTLDDTVDQGEELLDDLLDSLTGAASTTSTTSSSPSTTTSSTSLIGGLL